MKKLLKITLTVLFTTILLLGFAVPLNPVGNWYQQFMPSSPGGQIRDIYFVDSLLGFAVSDSSILKTTNSGDNWSVKQNGYYIFRRIHFLNSNIGYACAGNNKLLKTSNSGENWIELNLPDIFPFDMSVVSEDSIWIVNSNGLTGGVFRTTNGGVNWEQQLNIGSLNPTNIYMYNKNTGFAAENVLYKTTNSGVNWSPVGSEDGFTDMYFVNALTGWKANGSMKKTTNGGLNWIQQTIPFGGNIVITGISKFACLNKDTLLAVGGSYNTGGLPSTRGIIYRTIDGGNNWTFQIPDTAIHIVRYFSISFKNKDNVWAYNVNPTGIHTTTGGDPVWLTGIEQISTEIPKEYKLYQNYPNPFNPKTNIKYQISNNNSFVQISVYGIQGKLVTELVNQKQSPGTYEVDFSGNNYSSGVYFYKLIVGGVPAGVKTMILLK